MVTHPLGVSTPEFALTAWEAKCWQRRSQREWTRWAPRAGRWAGSSAGDPRPSRTHGGDALCFVPAPEGQNLQLPGSCLPRPPCGGVEPAPGNRELLRPRVTNCRQITAQPSASQSGDRETAGFGFPCFRQELNFVQTFRINMKSN